MISSTAMLAHQGGWDEILLVLGPIVLIAGVLAVAKRRVDAAAAGLEATSAAEPAADADHD